MKAPSRRDKFHAYRARKRASGLREVRLWLPDTRSPEFLAEARRQAARLNHSEDEREAGAMMDRLAVEARDDWR